MNPAHAHLVLNHLPVLGTAFGFGLLLLGLWRRSNELKKTALGVFVIIALASVPVYLTGEPAEGVVASLPGVSQPTLEKHEEAAGVGLTGVVLLGLVALGGLFHFRGGKVLPGWFSVSVIVLALIVGALMAWVANLGGQIRHSELRAGNRPPAAAGAKSQD